MGRVIIVSKETGSRVTKIGDAVKAAVAGDYIDVMPGIYRENNLMKGGVTINFRPGASVIWQDPGSGPGYGIFDDRAPGAAGVFRVTGLGEFTFRDTQAGNPNMLGAIAVTNASTDINFTCGKIVVSGPGASQNISAIYVSNCLLAHFNVNNITDTFETWAGSPSTSHAVYWEKGETFINFQRITMSAGYPIWCNEPAGSPSANIYMTGQLMSSDLIAAVFVTSLASTNYRVWINCLQIVTGSVSAVTSCVLLSGPAKVYIDAQKIASALNCIEASGNVSLWLRADKLTISADGGRWLNLTNTIGFIQVQHYETTANTPSATPITISGASSYVNLNGGYAKGGSGSLGLLQHSAGVTRVTDMVLDGTANNTATNRPVVSAGAGLTLAGCTILAAATADSSIFAGGAQTVKFTGTTIATRIAHANITQQPAASVVVDAAAGP